jgi:hypothetical protein
MKNLTLFIFFLSFVACQNAPKNELRSENTEKKDPSVVEQKTTDLAVETMPDSAVKPFLRKPPKAVHPVFGLFYPPIVRELPDTIKPEIGIVKSVKETPISTNFHL